MGGSGSGRYGSSAKTGDYHSVDLAYLKRNKLLRVGMAGSLTWSRGGYKTGSIRYRVESGGLRLIYRTRSWAGDEWRDVDELTSFTTTATNFGGERQWLRCNSCGRRCRIIYGGSLFRCRRCYDLKYETQYEQPWARVITKAQKVRMRLGGDGSMDDLFPPKPKGMHWQTYWRLEAQDELYQRHWEMLMSRWLGIIG